MSGNCRVLLLDLDGPVIDVSRRYYSTHRQLTLGLGLTPTGFDHYWEAKRRGQKEVDLLKAYGATQSQIQRYGKMWLEAIEDPKNLLLDRLQPGAADALETLAQIFAIYIVTMRRNKAGALEQIERFGIKRYIRKMIVCGNDGAGKAHAVKQERLTPIAFVGDSEADVQAARELGCPAYAVTCGIRNRDFLLGLKPDRVFRDLPEVASFLLRLERGENQCQYQ